MDIEQARIHALSFPNVTEDMPFGDDGVAFRIGGKLFMYLPLNDPEPRVVLKLPPEMGMELRERYAGVLPAWHWNKKHWNDVYIDRDEPTDQHIKTWIEQAYSLVRNKLPRRIKTELNIL